MHFSFNFTFPCWSVCVYFISSQYRDTIESLGWTWIHAPFRIELGKNSFRKFNRTPPGWACEWFALGEAQSWVNDKAWTAPLGKQMVGEWRRACVTNVILFERRRPQDLLAAWALGWNSNRPVWPASRRWTVGNQPSRGLTRAIGNRLSTSRIK